MMSEQSTRTFLGARAILYIVRQDLFIFVRRDGRNLVGMHSSLM